MSRPLALPLVAAALAVLAPTPAAAHERGFTQSRDWHLPYRGEHELELRSFFDTSHGDFRGQVEYEYGVTGWFALEPGLEIQENADGDYEVEGADLELRFRFGRYRTGAWLPALNLEYEHPFEDEEAKKLEVKGVLSRYGERDDFTVNLNYGREIEGEREDESELTAGWVRSLREAASEEDGAGEIRFGLELVEDFEAHHLRAGPLLTWRASARLHFLVSHLPAIDDRGEDDFDLLTVILEWEP